MAAQLQHLADGGTPNAAFNHAEWQQLARGVPITDIRARLAEAWFVSTDARDFEQALAEHELLLADGEKVPVVVTADGCEFRMLRTLNAHFKSQGLNRIKRSELETRLPATLPCLGLVRRVFTERLENIKKKPPKVVNSIRPAEMDEQNKWKQLRKQMLSEHYNQTTAEQLSQYWRVYQLRDGALLLENKAGRIIDRGNIIESHMKNNDLAAKTMVEMAIARGWDTVTVNGSDEFKQAHFTESQRQGLKVHIENVNDQKIWDRATKKIEQEQYTKSMEHKKSHRPRKSRGISLG